MAAATPSSCPARGWRNSPRRSTRFSGPSRRCPRPRLSRSRRARGGVPQGRDRSPSDPQLLWHGAPRQTASDGSGERSPPSPRRVAGRFKAPVSSAAVARIVWRCGLSSSRATIETSIRSKPLPSSSWCSLQFAEAQPQIGVEITRLLESVAEQVQDHEPAARFEDLLRARHGARGLAGMVERLAEDGEVHAAGLDGRRLDAPRRYSRFLNPCSRARFAPYSTIFSELSTAMTRCAVVASSWESVPSPRAQVRDDHRRQQLEQACAPGPARSGRGSSCGRNVRRAG